MASPEVLPCVPRAILWGRNSTPHMDSKAKSRNAHKISVQGELSMITRDSKIRSSEPSRQEVRHPSPAALSQQNVPRPLSLGS